MTSVLIQSSFEEAINDVKNGEVAETTFYVNFVPTKDLEDGNSKEELITVKLNNGSLQFDSVSGNTQFEKIDDTVYEVTYESYKYQIITPKKTIPTDIHDISSFDISPQESLYVVGGSSGTLSIGEVSDGKNITSIESAHFSDITKSKFFPSGKVVLTAGLDFQIKIWDAIDGSNPRTFSGHKQRITDLAMIDRGKHFISSSVDGLVKIWDCPTGSNIGTLSRSDSLKDGLNSVLITNSSSTTNLFAGHLSGVITQFDLNSQKEVSNFASLYSATVSLQQKDENTILSAYEDGIVALWDLRNSTSPLHKTDLGSEIVTANVTSNGEVFVSMKSGISYGYPDISHPDKNKVIGGIDDELGLFVCKGNNLYTVSSNTIYSI